jgi:hypothetical protein
VLLVIKCFVCRTVGIWNCWHGERLLWGQFSASVAGLVACAGQMEI